MKCLQATNTALKSRRGELLIESVLAMALLAILFAAVLLMITTSLNMVNQANASAAAQQLTIDRATRQDYLTDGTGRRVTITFDTDIVGLGGSVQGQLTDTDGFVAFAGG